MTSVKYLMTLWMCLISLGIVKAQESIYRLQTLEADTLDIESIINKKTLLVMVPVGRSTDEVAFLSYIDSMASIMNDSLVIIGILSKEESILMVNDPSTRSFIRDSLNIHLTIVKGTYMSLNNEIKPIPILSWLENAEENTHYGIQVNEYGQMFLLGEDRKLIAVLSKETKLKGKIMSALLRK